MRRNIGLILLVLVCMLALAGCGCEHEWAEADCVDPKTCTLCGEVEGAPLGHSWLAATCTESKTCEVCGEIEGEALGHSWADATCEEAKTCTACQETEGEALGHTWLEATTEAPQTCEVCAATEGERIITDPRFTTAACSPVFGKWESSQVTIPGSALGNGLDAYAAEISCIYTVEFSNDGNMYLTVRPADEGQIVDMLQRYTVDLMLQEFAAGGINEEDANAAMVQVYGMTIEEYVAAEVANMDVMSLFDMMNVNFIYYIEGSQMYLGYSWDAELEPGEFSVEGDTLYLPIEGDEPTMFTRVIE